MKHDWLISVLVDLIKFADSNNFPMLAQQLEYASIQAVSEIVRQDNDTLETLSVADIRDTLE
ncbi:hypothetical protein [uncultured Roseobacter sp.]|uniref:hypothetical protein n=1 Tax=uncultured Roseobacter sp. TaxID=114847 RepID=UPI0026352423|nr:hypothetical protein [uncultured Roseobacter sp.]